ncbi:MAG: PAS domain S-box protein, partial [Deltaproteobacteria bacterium]
HQIELEMQNEELRTTQVALEESRDGYLDLYEFAPVGYLALAESGLIREANLAACDLLGVERASLRGRRFAGFVVPESLASWGRLVSAVGSSANRSACDLTLQRKDGSLLDCHLECLRLAGGDGATSMRIALIDVTEQRKAEAGLRMREALLTAILDGTADGILVVGSTGKILRANRRFQAMWKISDDMVSSGDDDTLLAHVIDQLADPEAFLAEVRRLYTSSEVCFDRVPLADGRVFERFSFPFSFGGPNGRLWSFRDVTDRDRAEGALRESRSYLKTILDSALDGLLIIGPDRKTRDVNPALCAMTGYGREELLGMRVSDLEVDESPTEIEARFANTLKTGFSRFETRFRRKDGALIDVEASVRLMDGGDHPTVGLLRDVTESNRLQARLAVTSRLAAMGTLVAGIAHEINNPLAGTMASVDVALDDIQEIARKAKGGQPLEPGQAAAAIQDVLECLTDAKEGVERIARIVKKLVLFGRPDMGHETVRLGDVVQAALKSLPGSMARRAKVKVEAEADPVVRGASSQFEILVGNLVANAIQSIPEERQGEVRIRLGTDGIDRAFLEVIDDGQGIAPELIGRILDPFFTTQDVGEGWGSDCRCVTPSRSPTVAG